MAVFEGIRCYNSPRGPAVFRLREHLRRLLESARVLGMRPLPYTQEELRQAVHETIRANDLSECYIRPLLYCTNGPFDLNVENTGSSLGIAVWSWGTYLGEEALEKGVRMTISSFTRLHPNVLMTKAKISGNYVNSALAKTLAERGGFNEAIMLDPEGYVAECTGENIFLVRNGTIYTPPRAAILEGITRDSLLTLAQDLGIEVVEEPISRDQLYVADEVFVSGTAAECVAVSEIDYRVIGNGRMGPVTRTLQREFFQTVHGDGAHSEEWLDYALVPQPAQTRVSIEP
jgi:branched-chain amino acid aminotransferase